MPNVPYRIRIELPDRPGALANVASIIANQGGNVVSVDIHDIGGQHAVDEIVVMLPMDWQSNQLADELAKYDAGTLVSSTSAVVGSDSVVRALRWAASLVRSGAMDGGLELARAIAELCSSSVAWIATAEQAAAHPTGTRALEHGAPVTELAAPPPPMADGLPSPAWLLAVPDDPVMPQRVAFVGRPASLCFTHSEIARVEALLLLVREMSAAAIGP